MIFSRSSGLTTVLDAAPAAPPAMKYDETSGLKNASFSLGWGAGCGSGSGSAGAGWNGGVDVEEVMVWVRAESEAASSIKSHSYDEAGW